MGLVTDRIASDREAYVEVTYDDVTFDLTSVHGHTGVDPCWIIVRRGNGNAWKQVLLPANTDETYPLPAGPIRTLDDIPSFGLVTA